MIIITVYFCKPWKSGIKCITFFPALKTGIITLCYECMKEHSHFNAFLGFILFQVITFHDNAFFIRNALSSWERINRFMGNGSSRIT